MATEKRNFIPNTFYHVYNRGTSKQKIFLDDADKNRFTHLLYLCNGQKPFTYRNVPMKKLFDFSFEKGDSLVDICSWVLMNNHFHLLIYLKDEEACRNMSKFLSRLSASYLKFFNEKYNRTGNLFENRYQCIPVVEDIYLKYLFSYIHLNPLKILDPNWKQVGLKIPKANVFLNDYKFSSFHDLVVKKGRHEKKILSANQKVTSLSELANNSDTLFAFVNTDPRGSV
jgi:putative transposase